MALFSILVDIAAKTAGFEAGIKRVEDRVKGFENAVGKATRVFATFTGVTLSGAALVGFTKSALGAADAMGDTAERAGALASEFSRLNYAAGEADVSTEALTIGVKKLQTNISDAAAGTKAAVEKFEALGIAASDLKGLKLDEQLGIVADKFALLSSTEDKTRIATDLFGKSGNELIPMLAKGSAGIKALTEEADRLGITLDDRAVKSVDRASKALDRFWKSAKGNTANFVGTFLADAFGSGDQLLDAEYKLQKLNEERERLASGIGDEGAFSTRVVMAERIGAIDIEISRNEQLIRTLSALNEYQEERNDAGRQWQAIVDSFEMPEPTAPELPDIIFDADLANRRLEEFMRVNDAQTDATSEMYDEVTRLGKESSDEISARMIDNSGYWLEESLKNQDKFEAEAIEFVETFGSRFQGAAADIIYDGFEGESQNVGQIFGRLLKRMAAEAIAANLAGLMFGGKGGETSGLVSSAIGWLGSFFGNGAGAAGTGNWSGPRAAGGPVMAGGSYLVGERGPELFSPGTSGSITPNNKLGGTTIQNVYNFAPGSNVSRADLYEAVAQGSRATIAAIDDRQRRGISR